MKKKKIAKKKMTITDIYNEVFEMRIGAEGALLSAIIIDNRLISFVRKKIKNKHLQTGSAIKIYEAIKKLADKKQDVDLINIKKYSDKNFKKDSITASFLATLITDAPLNLDVNKIIKFLKETSKMRF